MSNHPYPDHVRDAVADAIESLFMEADTWEKIDAAHDNLADTALQALWEASRVEEREDGQLDAHDFPPGTLIETHHGELWVVTERHLWEPVADGREVLKPYSHIIYWGDTDE